jgi:hypothetical protein
VSKALAEWGIYVTEMKGLAFYWRLHHSEKID